MTRSGLSIWRMPWITTCGHCRRAKFSETTRSSASNRHTSISCNSSLHPNLSSSSFRIPCNSHFHLPNSSSHSRRLIISNSRPHSNSSNISHRHSNSTSHCSLKCNRFKDKTLHQTTWVVVVLVVEAITQLLLQCKETRPISHHFSVTCPNLSRLMMRTKWSPKDCNNPSMDTFQYHLCLCSLSCPLDKKQLNVLCSIKGLFRF